MASPRGVAAAPLAWRLGAAGTSPRPTGTQRRCYTSTATRATARPEVFEDHDITTPDQVIHALFNLEDQFGLVPNGEGMPAGLAVELTSVDLAKALRDWGRRREQLEAGEITLDEYRDWKDTYLPRILLDPVSGEEIDDPYTGRRLEGIEREGARRAVLAMGWLNE